MSLAAHALAEAPVSSQPRAATAHTQPPKRRRSIAKADAKLIPEAR